MKLAPQITLVALFIATHATCSLLRADDAPQQSEALTFPVSQRATELIPEVQQKIMQQVHEQFGNPLHPIIPAGIPVEAFAFKGLAVYSRHCARCHDAAGTGAGREAKGLQPRPRDFRRGIFKWKSTWYAQKPLRHDLRETIRLGIPNTSMPGFPNLTDAEANDVIEYVRWLSMAGEFQKQLVDETYLRFSVGKLKDEIQQGKTEKEVIDKAVDVIAKVMPEISDQTLKRISDDWKAAELETNILRPNSALGPAGDAAVQRGRQLFLSRKAGCSTCHGETGKGDGISTRVHWPIPGDIRNRKYPEPGLHDVWGHVNQPWDLTQGKLRGGDSPEDVFCRISAGISGTQMPGYGRSVFTEAEIWDMVSYVQSLPTEKPKNPKNRQPPAQGVKAE